MYEFLDKYGFISFNEDYNKYINKMLKDIALGTYDDRPCTPRNCHMCPFDEHNNIYDAWCGHYDNAMIGFGGGDMDEVKQILLQVKSDYEESADFWKIKE